MAMVEMEDFSDQQIWVLILLMLLGGEVFTSMLGLHLNVRANTYEILQKRLPSSCRDIDFLDSVQESKSMNQKYCKTLAHVVAGYFVVGVICSCLVVTIYIWTDSEAKYLLKSKNIKIWTFSIFTAVSSIVNCGFTPVNDNMAIFRKNPGFLLLVIPQILAGNTLFTPLLRLSIWALGRVSRREEYTYILQYPVETGYTFMQQQKNAINLVLTAVGITLLQMMLLCYFGWDSKPLEGLNWFQKLVCMLFQSVNTRHAGEAVIDISNLSPAILVLFALFMYHPSGGSSLPNSADDLTLTEKGEDKKNGIIWKNFINSKPISLATFIILACITERKSMSLDPLNFNIFSIIFEVVSAYRNVGYSLGYSCERLLKPDATCKAVSYGFVGKWTDEGKLIIILVMFLGRFKRLNPNLTCLMHHPKLHPAFCATNNYRDLGGMSKRSSSRLCENH
ncbi:hypothetical protein PVAP13_7KG416200 [Panicum virgatum]|uniref:Uncharacterized protein n=1 Tax=Panicum virgatum TaxID=38727 RepID=A0A8T0QHS5_PANVG|nr:hypothetical protein PVAP13_7KG416200 [Panicum virgatum]